MQVSNVGSYTGETVRCTDYKNAPTDSIELAFDPSIANSASEYCFADDLQPGETVIYRAIVYLPKNPPSFLMRTLWCFFTCGLGYIANYCQLWFSSKMDLKRTQLAVTSNGRLIFWENAQEGMEEPKCNWLACWACCFSYWCCTKKTLCTSCCKQPWCAPRKTYQVETKLQFASVKDISVIRHEYEQDGFSVFPKWSWSSLILSTLLTIGGAAFYYGFLVFLNICKLALMACGCFKQPFRTNLMVYFKHYPLNGSLDANPEGAFHPRRVNLASWDNVADVVAGKWGATWFYNVKADFASKYLAANPISSIGEAEKEIICMLIAFLSFLSFFFNILTWGLRNAIFDDSEYGGSSNDYMTYSGQNSAGSSDVSYCDYLNNIYDTNPLASSCKAVKDVESFPIGTISDLLTMLAGALVVASGMLSGFDDPLPYMKIVADEKLYMYNKTDKEGRPFAERADGKLGFDELHKINTLLTTLANQAKEPTIVRPCPPEWIANKWEIVDDQEGRHPRHVPSLDGNEGDVVKLSLANLPIDPSENIINVQRLGNVWNWRDWCCSLLSFGCHFFCNYNKTMAETTVLVLTDKRIMEVYTKSKSNFRKKNSALGCCPSLHEWDQTVTTYYLGDSIPSGFISRSLIEEQNKLKYCLTAGLHTGYGGFDIEISAPKLTTLDRIFNPLCAKLFCQKVSFTESNPLKWEGFIKSVSLTSSEITVPVGPNAPAEDEVPLEYRSISPYNMEYEKIIAFLESEYVRPFCTRLCLNLIWCVMCGLRPKLSKTKFALTTKRSYFISSKTNQPFQCWEKNCKVNVLSKDDYTVGWVDHSEIQMAAITCGADRNETCVSRMFTGGGMGMTHTVFQFAFDNLKPVWFALDWKNGSVGALDQDRVKNIRGVLSSINFAKNGNGKAIALPANIDYSVTPSLSMALPVESQQMDRFQEKEKEGNIEMI